jgi:AraC-like DNA-binding protein
MGARFFAAWHAGVVGESVEFFRSSPAARWFTMAGPARGYRVDPNGEIVLGVVTAGAMLVRRGGVHYVFGPGEACVWDASAVHAGTPLGCAEWHARVIVLEAPAIEDHLEEIELVRTGVTFPDPRVADPSLVARLVATHRCANDPDAPWLARDAMLAECVGAVVASVGAGPPPQRALSRQRARRDPALRRACEYLRARLTGNVALEDLATAAGVSRFRILRLFREAFGAPPHRYQLAQRIAFARRLLEARRAVGDVALETGFADQAHLHRHFVATIGVTPGRYARAFGGGVQERTRSS